MPRLALYKITNGQWAVRRQTQRGKCPPGTCYSRGSDNENKRDKVGDRVRVPPLPQNKWRSHVVEQQDPCADSDDQPDCIGRSKDQGDRYKNFHVSANVRQSGFSVPDWMHRIWANPIDASFLHYPLRDDNRMLVSEPAMPSSRRTVESRRSNASSVSVSSSATTSQRPLVVCRARTSGNP